MENLIDVFKEERYSAIAVLVIGLLSFAGGWFDPFKAKTTKAPIIIYKVDNAGSEIDGKISDKEIIEGRYTVTVPSYGKFLVTKEQYESMAVGDEIPDYLKKRGN